MRFKEARGFLKRFKDFAASLDVFPLLVEQRREPEMGFGHVGVIEPGERAVRVDGLVSQAEPVGGHRQLLMRRGN